MTTGALIFAFDNEAIDYVAMAAWSADNIHRHLDLPVCVVTDRDDVPGIFDKVVQIERTYSDARRTFEDIENPVTWYNQDRTNAYSLSPWDRTLLLDADYVIASDALRTVLQVDRDLLCHRWAYDMPNRDPAANNLNYFGSHSMPMWWATVIMFQKTAVSRFVFESMRMVRNNWRHYCDLYGVARGPYRNDYALSIALGIVSGHTSVTDEIPHAMINVLPDQTLKQQSQDQYQIIWRDSQSKDRYMQLRGVDFHAMCKGQLGAIVANHS